MLKSVAKPQEVQQRQFLFYEETEEDEDEGQVFQAYPPYQTLSSYQVLPTYQTLPPYAVDTPSSPYPRRATIRPIRSNRQPRYDLRSSYLW